MPSLLLFALCHTNYTPKAILKMLQMSKYSVALTPLVSNNSWVELRRWDQHGQVQSGCLITTLVLLLALVLAVSSDQNHPEAA